METTCVNGIKFGEPSARNGGGNAELSFAPLPIPALEGALKV